MSAIPITERRHAGTVATARRALYDAALAYAESARERNDVQSLYDQGQGSRDELHDANMLAVAQGVRLERRARDFTVVAAGEAGRAEK
jgi:hypothetical protein